MFRIFVFVFSFSFLFTSFNRGLDANDLLDADVFRDSILAAEKEKQKKSQEIWRQFADFKKLLSTFSSSEKKDYERAQKSVSMSDEKAIELIKNYDLMAFKRAYPHLATALNHNEVERSFYKYYQEHYSFGWRRRLAWFDRHLADQGKRNELKVPIFIDKSRSYLETKEGLLPNPKRFLALSYDQLLVLALCNDYKPAVLDIVKASRVQGQLKLTAELSYLLMLRVKQNKMRVIFKEEWLKEIDKDLTSREKKKLETLISDEVKLRKNLSYCDI